MILKNLLQFAIFNFFFQTAIVVNILVGKVLYGWRISVGIQALTGTVLALGMIVAPRSPRSVPLSSFVLHVRMHVLYLTLVLNVQTMTSDTISHFRIEVCKQMDAKLQRPLKEALQNQARY